MAMTRADYRNICSAMALSIPQETDTIWVCMFIASVADRLNNTYENFNSQKFMELFWNVLVANHHPVTGQV
jgi:hypothetical protein